MRKGKDNAVPFNKIQAATEKCSVKYGEETIEIKFKKSFWTSIVEQWYYDGEGWVSSKNNKLIAQNVIWWNMTEPDGSMTPITEENLELLDAFLVNEILQEMRNTLRPKRETSQD